MLVLRALHNNLRIFHHVNIRNMSTTDALARLPETLRTFVITATKDLTPPSPAAEKDVAQWIEKAASPDIGSASNIKALDAHLLSRTFLVGNSLTIADVAIYGALHPTISQEPAAQYHAHPALTRYFDHVQTRSGVRGVLPDVIFDLENAPKVVRTTEASKKDKKEKSVVKKDDAGAVKEEGSAKKEEGQGKKEKREKKEAAGADAKKGREAEGKKGKAAVVSNEPTAPVPSMIDLRVGKIIDVKKHPDADGLYVEQIDIGEETGPRTVVSGLVNYVPIEQMRDRRLVAVCNLKPATMRGVKSFAMVLCATSKEGREGGIEIIDPPVDAKPGERVYFEGTFENDTPLDQLNPKKKIFETIQPGFITLETREAAWVDPVSKSVHRIRTKEGVCVAPSFVGASLS